MVSQWPEWHNVLPSSGYVSLSKTVVLNHRIATPLCTVKFLINNLLLITKYWSPQLLCYKRNEHLNVQHYVQSLYPVWTFWTCVWWGEYYTGMQKLGWDAEIQVTISSTCESHPLSFDTPWHPGNPKGISILRKGLLLFRGRRVHIWKS